MKTFVALFLALFCLAPLAQAGGHFHGVSYGHGNYGYRSVSYAPLYTYSLFTPFIPVQAIYLPPPPPPPPPLLQAAPAPCPEVGYAPAYAPSYVPSYSPGYSTGFAGYAGSYGYGGGFGYRHFHRPPATPPKAVAAPKAIKRK